MMATKVDNRQVKLWVHLIKNGRKTIEDVPETYKAKVKKEVEKKA